MRTLRTAERAAGSDCYGVGEAADGHWAEPIPTDGAVANLAIAVRAPAARSTIGQQRAGVRFPSRDGDHVV